MLSSKLSGNRDPIFYDLIITFGILASPWQFYLEGEYYEAIFFPDDKLHMYIKESLFLHISWVMKYPPISPFLM